MPWTLLQNALTTSGGGTLAAVVNKVWSAVGVRRDGSPVDPQQSVRFTVAIVALAAKLSKADGVSTHIEADVFRRLFKVPEAEQVSVERLFDLAKQDTAGFESYAGRVGALLGDDADLKRDVLENLFAIAAADEVLHSAEDRYLAIVAARFGMSPADLASVRARFVKDESDPYTVLGVERGASPDDIRSRYLWLVKHYHPDVLAGRGLPPGVIERATSKMAEINDAYAKISQETVA